MLLTDLFGSDDNIAKHLREHYIFSDAEKIRREDTRLRVDLFNDRGEAQIHRMVDDLFKNARVRHLRKQFVELASFQNLTRRIIREISSVYSEPAQRKVKSERMNERYQDLQRKIHLDRRMRVGNQMLNLCNEVVTWFDIQRGQPVLRIVTPDNFWAVSHPDDPTDCVALIFDKVPGKGQPTTMSTPFYLVVTDDEMIHLNQLGHFLSRKPHGLSRMPMQLIHRMEPTTSLLNPDPGKDIIAAHKALTLINVMMLKHQKSGTKQAYASGDLGDMPRDQPMEEEHLLQAPEGVSFSTLDLGANPDNYINAARSVIKQIAANQGIPESVFDLSYQATSGFEIELKRTGLREVRRDQILDWRPVERNLSLIMEEVLAKGRSPYAFNSGGWSINFGEVETPQEPMAMLTYWEKQRQMGLINTVDMLMHLNPEMTPQQAEEQIAANALIEAKRVDLFRRLNMSPETPADGSDGANSFNSDSSETANAGSQSQSGNPAEQGAN